MPFLDSSLRSSLRRDAGVDADENNDSWWWSSTAYAVKWGIIGAIFLAAAVFLISGYIHAKRRIAKGLPPLAYHRWLLNRRQREQFETPQNTPPFYRTQVRYNMPDFRPPPPAYNPDTDYVPAYSPPEGGSKINPSQNYAEAPPAGPPPSHSPAESSAKSPTVTLLPPEASGSSDRR